VDAARRANSTSFYVSECDPNPPPPTGGGCTEPLYLWFWTWVPRYCAGAPGSCLSPSDYSPLTISQYTYKIMLRSTPNAPFTGPGTGCVGGTPSQSGCTWLTITAAATVSSPVSFTVAGPLYDVANDNYYDVAAVRIDVSGVDFPTNAQCQTAGGTDCQFFLVVNDAQATGGGNTASISWDNDQTLTQIGSDNTGFQVGCRGGDWASTASQKRG
jgi:hypothetical protein